MPHWGRRPAGPSPPEVRLRIAVIGGSAGGLTAALLLARAGHAVTVLEVDHLEPAADVETAAAAGFRAAAPQIVQPHVLLTTFQEILRERLPDVDAGLRDAGAVEATLQSQMPPTLADRSPAPGDERLVLPDCPRRPRPGWSPGSTSSPSASGGGDNATMQLVVAPLAADRRFAPARREAVFTAVLRTIPLYASWLDVMDPITDVVVMGGLHNTLRRLVVDGRPVVLGLHAVGDAVCTTNPTFGRGLSMTLHGAADLVDVLAAHPDDLAAQVLAMDRAVSEHVAPWFADQAVSDAARLAMLRHTVLGAPSPPAPDPARVTFGQIRQAGQVDPVAFRAVWRLMGMIGRPSDAYDDPDLAARVRAALAAGAPPAVRQPTRAQLEAALAA